MGELAGDGKDGRDGRWRGKKERVETRRDGIKGENKSLAHASAISDDPAPAWVRPETKSSVVVSDASF